MKIECHLGKPKRSALYGKYQESTALSYKLEINYIYGII